MPNANLHAAKRAKNDEFYTQWRDIEREMLAYTDHDPDVFRGKTVLLPCDDPQWSNFTKFFAAKFHELGLKKLISTSYGPGAANASNPDKRGRVFVTTGEDVNTDGVLDADDFVWEYLDGDGDFRSPEVTALRDEADVVITNPPFSMFHDFLAWCVAGGVAFSMIGNMNAITYRETFPLIRSGAVWLGATSFNAGMYFGVPDDFVYAPTYKFEREIDGRKVSLVPGICWFTNIDHGRRHEALALMTMADNRDFSRDRYVREVGYPRYDRLDAIEVHTVASIPSDFDGIMGVPITFLGKHNPEQFEIVGCSYSYGRPDGWSTDVPMSPTVGGLDLYKRLFIRHRNPKEN